MLLLQCLRPLAQVDTVCWARLTAVATNWPLTCSVAHLLSWRVALLRQSDRQLVTRCCCWLPVCSGQPVHSSSSSSSSDETLSSSQFSICQANQINWRCLFTVHLDMTSCLLPNCFAGFFAWSVHFLFLVMICVDRVSYDFCFYQFWLILSLLDCYSCHCWAHCIIYLL